VSRIFQLVRWALARSTAARALLIAVLRGALDVGQLAAGLREVGQGRRGNGDDQNAQRQVPHCYVRASGHP
jgi:hypothetical protein